jgi:exodeoxyribonuclease VIII
MSAADATQVRDAATQVRDAATKARAAELTAQVRAGLLDYWSVPALHSSNIGDMLRSQAHYRHALTQSSDSAAYRVGRAVHCAALEPGEFDQRFIVAPDRRTNAGKAAAAAAQSAGLECLTEAEMETARAVAAVVMPLLPAGEREVPYFWEADGVLNAAKADIIGADGYLYDLKSTDDATDFRWSARKYGYAMQAAHYLDGAQSVGMPALGFRWIVVEKSAPHGVMLYEASPETVAAGMEQVREARARLALSEMFGDWPGYPADWQVI